MAVVLPTALSSCTSVRPYWGIEGECELPFYDDDDYYYRPKHKHKKHKKHKKHHHHDDDDSIGYNDEEFDIPM